MPGPPAYSCRLNAGWVAPAFISDKYLTLGYDSFEDAWIQLRFDQNFDLQEGFDGGVLEVSPFGGPFNDVGGFTTGGYNSVITPSSDSPIAGQQYGVAIPGDGEVLLCN